MNKELITFNIDEIYNQFAFFQTLKNYPQIKQGWIRTKDIFLLLESSFQTNTKQIRDSIEEYFGIKFKAGDYSHNRNQITKFIKKINVKTSKGKTTSLNFEEYKNLITLPEFIDFITENMNLNNVSDKEKSYYELKNLLNNTYYQSDIYKRDQHSKRYSEAYILNLFYNTSPLIKECYEACFYLKNNIPLPDIYTSIPDDLIEVASQREFANYKFDSPEDIKTTNNIQIIRMFLDDIDRWDNKKEPN